MGLEGVRAEVLFLSPPDGGPRLELLRYLSPAGTVFPAHALPNTPGLRHLAFRVADIDAVAARLRGEGIAVATRSRCRPGSSPAPSRRDGSGSAISTIRTASSWSLPNTGLRAKIAGVSVDAPAARPGPARRHPYGPRGQRVARRLLLAAAALAVAFSFYWGWKRPLPPSGGFWFETRLVLAVPSFRQNDPRWGHDPIGATADTLGGQGCAVASAAMVLAFYGVDTDPQRLNGFLNANGGYTPQGWLYWEKAALGRARRGGEGVREPAPPTS